MVTHITVHEEGGESFELHLMDYGRAAELGNHADFVHGDTCEWCHKRIKNNTSFMVSGVKETNKPGVYHRQMFHIRCAKQILADSVNRMTK